MMGMKACPFCAEVIKAEAIKCRYCGSSLESQAARAVETIRPATVEPVPAPVSVGTSETAQPRRNWPAAVGAVVIALAIVSYVSAQSVAVAVVLVVISAAALSSLAVGRFASAVPPIVVLMNSKILAHRRWSFAAIAVALLGGAAGLNQQAKPDDRAVDDAPRSATSLPGSPTQPTTRAPEVPGAMTVEGRRTAALADAKKAAATPGSEAQAVAWFRRAAALGPLDAESSKLFAAQLLENAKRFIAAKDFTHAVKDLEEARRRDASIDGIDALIASAEKSRVAGETTKKIDAALETAKNKCDSTDDLTAAWNGIREIGKDNEQRARAVAAAAGLERCRSTMYQAMLKTVHAAMQIQREKTADSIERTFLGKGMDAHVRLDGATKNQLTIVYILFTRASAFQLTDGGSKETGSFLENAERGGFKRVTFADGHGESWSYDLDPAPEERALLTSGLSDPFRF